jgi:endonuclease/exonuclease/phosphatase family metal-dependent hydrolase
MKNLLSLIIVLIFFSTVYSQNVSVMTYNIRLDIASDGENAWEFRKDFLLHQIQFYSPDIIGTQEGRPNQIKYMHDSLPHYNFIGHGREGGNHGEYSAIFYNSNNVKVEKENTFWLSQTPEKKSKGWDAAYERICTYGLFTDLKSLKKFWVFNTHLDHVGELARLNGLKLIQKRIAEINTQKYPVIFMGDLNAEPDTEIIQYLQNEMLDTKSVAKLVFGPNGTFNGFQFNNPVNRRIDYIFISKVSGIVVDKYAVLSDSKDLKYPSDHLPVFTVLRLP